MSPKKIQTSLNFVFGKIKYLLHFWVIFSHIDIHDSKILEKKIISKRFFVSVFKNNIFDFAQFKDLLEFVAKCFSRFHSVVERIQQIYQL